MFVFVVIIVETSILLQQYVIMGKAVLNVRSTLKLELNKLF